jgi:hypothetical protein
LLACEQKEVRVSGDWHAAVAGSGHCKFPRNLLQKVGFRGSPPRAAKKACKVAVSVTNYDLDIELKKVQSYEKGHKNRNTVVEQLDRRISEAS